MLVLAVSRGMLVLQCEQCCMQFPAHAVPLRKGPPSTDLLDRRPCAGLRNWCTAEAQLVGVASTTPKTLQQC